MDDNVVSLARRDDTEIAEAKKRIFDKVPDDCSGFAVVWFTRKSKAESVVNSAYHVRDSIDSLLLPHLAFNHLLRRVNEE